MRKIYLLTHVGATDGKTTLCGRTGVRPKPASRKPVCRRCVSLMLAEHNEVVNEYNAGLDRQGNMVDRLNIILNVAKPSFDASPFISLLKIIADEQERGEQPDRRFTENIDDLIEAEHQRIREGAYDEERA
jgi:hypothetical protein